MEWPLFDLRLRCGPVSLRAVTDADLPRLAAILPDDLDLDPRVERFAGLDAARDRQRLMVQGVWRSRGSWSPSSWCLDLAVEHDGRLVGVQALEGDDFVTLRTVDSYSWLAAGSRGKGIGVAMREAALGPSPSTTSVRSLRSPRRYATTRRRWECRDGSGTPTTGSAAPAPRTASWSCSTCG